MRRRVPPQRKSTPPNARGRQALSNVKLRPVVPLIGHRNTGDPTSELTRRRESIPMHRDRRTKQVAKHAAAARVQRFVRLPLEDVTYFAALQSFCLLFELVREKIHSLRI